MPMIVTVQSDAQLMAAHIQTIAHLAQADEKYHTTNNIQTTVKSNAPMINNYRAAGIIISRGVVVTAQAARGTRSRHTARLALPQVVVHDTIEQLERIRGAKHHATKRT